MSTASNITPNMDAGISALFDALTTTNCLTREDIAIAGGFVSVPAVDAVLGWIRNPDIAAVKGWTVPHVRRGRPYGGQNYRYMVVDPAGGQALDPEAILLIKEGTLSTVRQVSTASRNQAEALRMTVPISIDKKYKKWARDIATVLDGVSVQASLEAERLAAII